MLLLVCAAVYMNWRYTDNIQKNAGKTLGQTTLVSSQDGEKGQESAAAPAEDDYFATARLSRKQARDNAISMLREAERDENAQQSVLNEASQTLQVLAAYTVAESQIESLVTAKGYADCVVFMGAESVSVVVAPPEGGLLITATAGTMESNDIMVTLEPAQSGGIQISLTSNVLQQFGRQIEAVIRDTLTHYGIENAEVTAVDKGALDCTVRARVTAAIFRSAQSDAYEWEVK